MAQNIDLWRFRPLMLPALLSAALLGLGARCSHFDRDDDLPEEPFAGQVAEKSIDGGPINPPEVPDNIDEVNGDQTYDDGDLPLQEGADEKL